MGWGGLVSFSWPSCKQERVERRMQEQEQERQAKHHYAANASRTFFFCLCAVLFFFFFFFSEGGSSSDKQFSSKFPPALVSQTGFGLSGPTQFLLKKFGVTLVCVELQQGTLAGWLFRYSLVSFILFPTTKSQRTTKRRRKQSERKRAREWPTQKKKKRVPSHQIQAQVNSSRGGRHDSGGATLVVALAAGRSRRIVHLRGPFSFLDVESAGSTATTGDDNDNDDI